MTDVFISYSRQDVEYARIVDKKLHDYGIPSWRDEGKFPYGEDFVSHISEALFGSKVFLLIAPRTGKISYWSKRELLTAKRLRSLNKCKALIVLGNKTDLSELDIAPDLLLETDLGLESIISSLAFSDTEKYDSHKVNIYRFHPYAAARSIWLGYSDVLGEIDNWWLGNKERCIWISGGGGVGKTALSWQWIYTISQLGYELPQLIDVGNWSFYDNPNIEPAINALKSLDNPENQFEKVVLLDGLEKIDDDESISLVRIVYKLGFRMIVTSRTSPVKNIPFEYKELKLTGLAELAVLGLLSSLEISQEDKVSVAKSLKGHPLSIAIAKGLISKDPNSINRIIGFDDNKNSMKSETIKRRSHRYGSK